MTLKDCIFCKIVEKQIPSKIIFENEKNMVFLDIFPISPGHSIIIPKTHYSNIEDIPDEQLSELFKAVKAIAKILRQKLNLEGYNILQNNYEAAGQVVKHIHVHIIPRSSDDKRFNLKIPREQATDDELEIILKMLHN